MSEADIQLLLTALGGVALLVALIVTRIRLHPLIALLVVSLAVGIAAGMDMSSIAGATVAGAGHTLGVVGIVIALGAMLGKILADSGVTEAIADAILTRSSDRMLPWAMAFVAFVVGIPMFFEVGLVVLLPLIFSVARKLEGNATVKGSPYVLIGVPVIAALASLHGMVPPHPGPLTAIATLKTSVGPTMVYGFISAIPAIILAGPLYVRLIAPGMSVRPDQALLDQFTASGAQASSDSAAPLATKAPIGVGVLAVLMPAILMLANTLGETLLPKNSWGAKVTAFLGDPLIAMLAGVLFASVTLVYLRGGSTEKLREALGASLKPIAGILLIIAGGGAFQQILVKAKVGDAIVHLTQHFALPPLLLGWMIAMLLSVSTGSATVGIVGAAGLLAPLAAADPSLNLPLLALSIGSGSLFFNYANHAGFWLVKESFGMTMGEATKTISVIQSIVALVGLGMVLLLNLFPALPS
ncbi:gluconate transporter [Bradyrhizobium sp. LTSPM299]|uniref:GntP family permease n=1 Tax=Bradyrhizobium sp. LTSPM299 TaxID=1619233 RepID=UPI0005C96067|nr:gluconate:H+ symporter [Bradyrhizobium sp. LTSPM299]KJC59581.1 gluconate transporter [Bradyrhizobium sp. LTSPM299]